MTLRLQIMVIIFIVLAVLYIVNQLRKKKLDYRFGLGWLLIIFCILVLTVSPKLLSMLAGFLGITLPINMLFFFGFCFMALQFTGQASFQALGEAKYAIFFSIFRKVIIVVPLTILLPMIPALGLNGVFIAEPVSNLVGGCASFFTMLYVVWFHKLKED